MMVNGDILGFHDNLLSSKERLSVHLRMVVIDPDPSAPKKIINFEFRHSEIALD